MSLTFIKQKVFHQNKKKKQRKLHNSKSQNAMGATSERFQSNQNIRTKNKSCFNKVCVHRYINQYTIFFFFFYFAWTTPIAYAHYECYFWNSKSEGKILRYSFDLLIFMYVHIFIECLIHTLVKLIFFFNDSILLWEI